MTGQTGAKKGESLSCTAERFMRRPPCRPGVREGRALRVRAVRTVDMNNILTPPSLTELLTY